MLGIRRTSEGWKDLNRERNVWLCMGLRVQNSNSESKYLFIDGASLIATYENLVTKIYPDPVPDIDWSKIIKGYDRVFYYDALPAKKDNETQEQYEQRFDAKKNEHDKLKTLSNFHVREGVSRFRRRTRGTEQKGVDILLAIEAYQQALQSNMDTAEFILSDLDFFPLLEALVNTRVKTRLIYDVYATSRELVHSADQSQSVNGHYIDRWLSIDTNVVSRRMATRFSDAPTGMSGQEPILKFEVDDQEVKVLYWPHAQDGEFCIFSEQNKIIASYSLYLCLERAEMLFEMRPGALTRLL